jgi:hypothetical protein
VIRKFLGAAGVDGVAAAFPAAMALTKLVAVVEEFGVR